MHTNAAEYPRHTAKRLPVDCVPGPAPYCSSTRSAVARPGPKGQKDVHEGVHSSKVKSSKRFLSRISSE